MSLHFTALDIFERTPSPVLQKALNRLRVPVPDELQTCTGPSSEAAYPAFTRLPQTERDKAEPWIGFVRELSDPDGRRVLGQLAARDRVAVPVDRESLKNATAVAVWFSAERPTLFEQALACRQYIGLSNRTLHERTDLLGAAADTSSEALTKLRTGLSKHFDTQEQRGGRVTVRTVPYGDGQTIFLAHIDDYPDCYPTHEGGRFGHRVIYPTFTVSYLFDAVRGSLAVNVAGGRPARRAVEACFFESVLGREYAPPPVGAVFRLAHLFDADQQFAPVAGGGATAAGVEFVRFRHRSKNRVHTFAVAPDSTDTAVGVFTGSYDRKAMPRSDVEILHARFRFRYAGPSGRGKLFRVSVTGNDRSNLKSLSSAERGIAEAHLVAWGVMDE